MFGDILEELLDIFIQKEPWKEQAACNTVDRSNFFLSRGQSSKTARATCQRCEVQAECEEYANKNGLEGWWGGRLHKPAERSGMSVYVEIQDFRPRRVDPVEPDQG